MFIVFFIFCSTHNTIADYCRLASLFFSFFCVCGPFAVLRRHTNFVSTTNGRIFGFRILDFRDDGIGFVVRSPILRIIFFPAALVSLFTMFMSLKPVGGICFLVCFSSLFFSLFLSFFLLLLLLSQEDENVGDRRRATMTRREDLPHSNECSCKHFSVGTFLWRSMYVCVCAVGVRASRQGKKRSRHFVRLEGARTQV